MDEQTKIPNFPMEVLEKLPEDIQKQITSAPHTITLTATCEAFGVMNEAFRLGLQIVGQIYGPEVLVLVEDLYRHYNEAVRESHDAGMAVLARDNVEAFLAAERKVAAEKERDEEENEAFDQFLDSVYDDDEEDA